MEVSEIIEKICADNCISAKEFSEKIGKNHGFISNLKSGRTSKFTPAVIRIILEKFPKYSPDWLRTGEPPIYAADVQIHGNGNIGNGNNNNVTTINDRLLAAVESMCETARIHAEAAKTNAEAARTNAETIAILLKNSENDN